MRIIDLRRARSAGAASGWRRLRARHRWLDHLARALDRYLDHYGYHYVASIAYFSLLSLVPMLMVAVSVFGYVLAGRPHLLDQLLQAISGALPGTLGAQAGGLLRGFIDQRTRVGVAGLAVGLYSGWNWMNALRDGLTAMWDQAHPRQGLVRTVAVDLLALLGLTLALLVSFALSASGGVAGAYLLRLAGVSDRSWAHTALSLGSVPLALLANWLVFLWVFTRLPRNPVGVRSAIRGAAAAAIGFELLKQAGNLYLGIVGRSPSGIAFGSAIGLLVFISLVSRMVVFITAWIATARDTPRPPPPPGPVTVRPVVVAPPRRPAVPAAAGVLAGALGTLLLERFRKWLRARG